MNSAEVYPVPTADASEIVDAIREPDLVDLQALVDIHLERHGKEINSFYFAGVTSDKPMFPQPPEKWLRMFQAGVLLCCGVASYLGLDYGLRQLNPETEDEVL